MNSRRILMIPGPSEAEPEILSILCNPVKAHYGVEWGQFYNETLETVRKIFKSSGEIILLPGPGNCAIDFAILNILEPGDKAIVVVNGFFGEVLAESAALHGAEVVRAESDYGRAVDPEQIRRMLEENRDVKAILVPHSETSTGVANSIEKIGEISRKYGTLFVVDAVSSFGGMNIDVDRWSIDFCIGYSSKALSSVTGVIPISIGSRVWEAVKRRCQPVKGYFLNLLVWRRFIDEWGPLIGHPHPCTVPTSLVAALRRAAELALEEGLEKRYRRHAIVAKAVRQGFRALGLQPLAPEEEASSTITVVTTPDGVDTKIREILLKKYDIMIGGGLSKLKGRSLRVGHMGVTASHKYAIPMLAAVGGALNELGLTSSPGAAVDAAEQVLSELKPVA